MEDARFFVLEAVCLTAAMKDVRLRFRRDATEM
jgi:hypothetical protein